MGIPILWQICLAIDSLIYHIAAEFIRVFFEVASVSANISEYSETINFV